MRRYAVMAVLCAAVLVYFAAASRAKEKSDSSPVAGTWNCVAHGGENGDIPFTLYLEQSANGLTGTVSAPQGDADLTSVTLDAGHIKITIDTDEHNYSLAATLSGGKLEGEWSMDGQKKGTWEGKK